MPRQETYISVPEAEPNYLCLFHSNRARSPLSSCSQSTSFVEIDMQLLHFLAFVPLAVGVQYPPPSFTLSTVATYQSSGRSGPVTSEISFEFSDPFTASCGATWF